MSAKPVFFFARKFTAELALLVLGLSSCSLIPTATVRDARTLDPGQTETTVALSVGSSDYSDSLPSTYDVGGLTFDQFTYRRGVTTGIDESFTLGSGGVLFVPLPILAGLYAGYERGYTLAKVPAGGSVLYCGVLAGTVFGDGQRLGQADCGLITGRTEGTIRPELDLKALAMVTYSWYTHGPVTFGVLKATPRIRLAHHHWSVWAGLGFGTLLGVDRFPDVRGVPGIDRTVLSLDSGFSW